MKLTRQIQHWLFGCAGYADHEIDERGIAWVGLRCVTCGKLKSPTVSRIQSELGRATLTSKGEA